MQDERKAFGRGQRIKQYQQRHADGIREDRFVLGIGPPSTGKAGLDDPRVNRFFTPRLP